MENGDKQWQKANVEIQAFKNIALIKLDSVDQKVNDLKNKVEYQDELIRENFKLDGNIKVLTEQIKQLTQSTNKIAGRLEALEERPVKRWDSLIAAAIAGFTSLVIGLLFKK